MKRKIICVLLAFILIFTIFLFTGCDKDKEYVEFDIDDVSLEFSYGGFFSQDIELELRCGRNISQVELYFQRFGLDESAMLGDEQFFVKKTTESYISEEYRCVRILDENNHMTEIKFNHKEMITIPKELFIGENGRIAFIVKGNDINDTHYGIMPLSGIWIFYTVDGNKVTLSESEKSSPL